MSGTPQGRVVLMMFMQVLVGAGDAVASAGSGGLPGTPLTVSPPPLVVVVCEPDATPVIVHLKVPPEGPLEIPAVVTSLEVLVPGLSVRWGENVVETDDTPLVGPGTVVDGTEAGIEVCL